MELEDTRKSTRLSERRKRQVEEEERKARKERKRAKTMFQRKSKVIAPNDLLVDPRTGKIHLGSEEAPQDVKVKVEPNDLEEALESSGFSEKQGEVIVTHELINKREDDDGARDIAKDRRQEMIPMNESLVGNPDEGEEKPEGNTSQQHHEDIKETTNTACPEYDSDGNDDIGLPSEFQDIVAERNGCHSLPAMLEQLKKEMKERFEEQDQKIVQLTTELRVVKEKSEARINELHETIAELQLQLSSIKDFPEGTAAKEGLVATSNQLQGQVSQGHLLAQNDNGLEGNPDQDGWGEMAMMSSESNKDNSENAVKMPDVSLPKEKSRDERIKAPLFEAVLNILVERKRTTAGDIHWNSVCGVMKKFRLVCKSWKASVDSFMQNHPSHLQFWDPLYFLTDDTIYHTAPCPLTLYTVTKVEGSRLPFDIFPSDMGDFIMSAPSGNMDSNYNPVPTRYLLVKTTNLSFSFQSPEHTARVYKLSEYLRVFGHRIWYLRLSLDGGLRETDFDDVCRSISEILELVPNLKLLSLDIDFSYVFQISRRIELSESVNQYQFPHLKHLVVFECFQVNPVILQILKANSHVQSLAFHDLWHYESTGILTLDLPNFSELFIISYNDLLNKEIFREATVTWKIRKMELQLDLNRRSSSLYSIDGLKIFGDSLEDLKLEFRHHDFRLIGAQLKLPRLKCLHVKTERWDNLEWGVLLAELKVLERLEIVVDLWGYAAIGSIHEEPHWLAMPELRSVTLVASPSSPRFISREEERKVFKLTRVGMPTVKFNYIKVRNELP